MPRDESAAPPLPSIESLIARYGLAVLSIGYGVCAHPGCNCRARIRHPWTYSVGLSALGLPELVVMGLEPFAAQTVVNLVAEARRAGQPVPLDQPVRLDGVRLKVLDVPDTWVLTDTSRMAEWFRQYGAVPDAGLLPDVQQVVVADRYGRFPGEPGCDPRLARAQPILRDAPQRYPLQSMGPRQRHPRRDQRQRP